VSTDYSTIYIIDDDASVRDALSLLISLKGMRARVFACAEDFLGNMPSEVSGCILTDLKMPGLSGEELQIVLRQREVTIPLVVLTAHGSVSNARIAFKNGAFDFLEKPVDDDLLVDVLRNAVQLSHPMAPNGKDGIDERVRQLSARETEVFRLLSQGLLLREIAVALGISPRTVEVHKARVMAKLQCRTLADLIRMSIEASS
jgi:two-component system response regulator FixJ